MLTRKKHGYAAGGMMDAGFLCQDLDELDAALRSGSRTPDKMLADSVEVLDEARRLRIPDLIGKALLQRADLLIAAERYPEAIAAAEEAGQELGQARRHDLKVGVFVRMAKAFGHLKDWPAVVKVCAEGIELTESYRYHVHGQYLQSAYLRSRIGLYSWGVRAAYELRDQTLMLQWAELSKCRSVLRYQQQPLAPADRLEQTEQEFRRVCRQIEKARAQAAGVASEELLKKRRILWDLLLIQRAQSRSTALPSEFSLETVQSSLSDDEAAVYYYWIDKQSLLIVFIDRLDCMSALQPVTPQERQDLESFASFVLRFSPTSSRSYLNKAQRFASLLAPPWVLDRLQGKRRLLISPHQMLHAIPFHALRILGPSPGEERYLIQRFAVAYLPNLTSLALRYPAPKRMRVLAVGTQEYRVPGHPELPPLADVELEIDELRRLYEAQGVAIVARRGAEANEDSLRRLSESGELATFSCLHFAAHGVSVDSDTPMESYLFLRDSILEGLEIAAWRLNAPLVVLSACCSGQRAIEGRGKEDLPGDDMFGLQAAFFAAGAKQALGALWPVDSEAARELMVAFHRGLAQGEAPDLALQAAIVGYLDAPPSDHFRSLFYWAPFFLSAVGRPETSQSIHPEEKNHG
jgi:CHAT domain-containing protein